MKELILFNAFVVLEWHDEYMYEVFIDMNSPHHCYVASFTFACKYQNTSFTILGDRSINQWCLSVVFLQ